MLARVEMGLRMAGVHGDQLVDYFMDVIEDCMTAPETDISEIQPSMTMVGGEIVFLHPQFAEETGLRPQGAAIATYDQLNTRRGGRAAEEF